MKTRVVSDDKLTVRIDCVRGLTMSYYGPDSVHVNVDMKGSVIGARYESKGQAQAMYDKIRAAMEELNEPRQPHKESTYESSPGSMWTIITGDRELLIEKLPDGRLGLATGNLPRRPDARLIWVYVSRTELDKAFKYFEEA